MKSGNWFIIDWRQRLTMKSSLGLLAMTILVSGIIAAPLSVNAQTYQQTVATDVGTIKVGINIDPASPKPGETSKLKIDFLNPQTGNIQEHVDYTVTVTNAGSPIFGPIPLTHTSIGSSTIPMEFKNGDNQVVIEVQGILFRPIPTEKATFSITLGDKPSSTQQKEQPKQTPTVEKTPQKPSTTDTKKKTASVSIDKKASSTTVKKDTKTDKKTTKVKTPIKKPVKKTTVKKTTTTKKTSVPAKKTTTKY